MGELESWYAVRTVSLHPEGVFEERITLWRSASEQTAMNLAMSENLDYCEDVDATDCGIGQLYRLDPDQPARLDPAVNGIELFSLMRRSSLPISDYLTTYFDTGEELQRYAD